MAKVNENQESIEKFIQMYEEGIPNKEIGDYFGIKPNTVCYWAKKLGCKMRGSGKKNKYQNPFENQSPERDYWLGYLFADGHIQRGVIDLYSVDLEVIEAYKNFVKGIGTITTENYIVNSGEIHTIYKYHIYSVDISEWFINEFNVSSTKHHNLNPIVDINWDIIRGYFDGDGSAHKVRGFTLNSSSEVWIQRIWDYIKEELDIEAKINQYLECYKLCVWSKDDLSKLIPKLYQNDTFCLERKKIKFEPFISNDNRKLGELREDWDVNPQPSQPLTKLEGSETND